MTHFTSHIKMGKMINPQTPPSYQTYNIQDFLFVVTKSYNKINSFASVPNWNTV